MHNIILQIIQQCPIKCAKTERILDATTVWVKTHLLPQNGSLSLRQEAANTEALQQEISSSRKEWDSLLSEAQNIAQAMGIPPEFTRSRQRKCQLAEDRLDAQEAPDVTFRNSVCYVAVGSISA